MHITSFFYFAGSNSNVDLLVEYFKRFGDKSSCFWDLAPYLHLNLQELSEKEQVRQLVHDGTHNYQMNLQQLSLIRTWLLNCPCNCHRLPIL